ncbi:hypothetical protein ACFQV2_18865 [Actinokineospora soli]|uniref:Uncharacterized protein n=1 Tax=Actinokineospora soli TaxID=1048753 RepID=A0ABW2TNA4_9PSEU
MSELNEGAERSRLLRVLGSVSASTTTLAALMFYFGRQHAYWFFDYFGVNFTVMGLTAQDYLVRSADGLFTPLAVVAAIGIVGLWGRRLMRRHLSSKAWRRVVRSAHWTSVALGLLTTSLAVMALIDPVAFYAYPALPGSCLAAGVVLLTVATRPTRRRADMGLPEWGRCSCW